MFALQNCKTFCKVTNIVEEKWRNTFLPSHFTADYPQKTVTKRMSFQAICYRKGGFGNKLKADLFLCLWTIKKHGKNDGVSINNYYICKAVKRPDDLHLSV